MFDATKRRVVVTYEIVFEEEKKRESNRNPAAEARTVGGTFTVHCFPIPGTLI